MTDEVQLRQAAYLGALDSVEEIKALQAKVTELEQTIKALQESNKDDKQTAIALQERKDDR